MNIDNRQKDKLGYLYVALAAVLFAISGTSAKFLFHSGITPYQLIQLRTTLAFTCLLIWLCLRHSALLKISISDLPYFLALGVLGIGAAQFLYLFAISKIIRRALCRFCPTAENRRYKHPGHFGDIGRMLFSGRCL